MRLVDKVAIVTGGANGLGKAIVRRFAEEGASIVIADVLEAEGMALVDELKGEGVEISFAATDITREEDWRSLVGHVRVTHGRLDILVNNAGISGSGAGGAAELAAWQKLMTVNVQGAFLSLDHAASLMAENGGGAIVNIASIMAMVGSTTVHLGYHASKSALTGLAKAAACRLGPSGVRINTVLPGFLPPMRGSQIGPALDEHIRQTPLRRLGRYEDVADAVLFLASDEACFVTAAELVVDGGYVARD